MRTRQLRAATRLVCRECLPSNADSFLHVMTSVDAFLGSYVFQSAFNTACEQGASVAILEYLLSRTVPNWREAIRSSARNGHLHVLNWTSERKQDGLGAWTSDYDDALQVAAASGQLEVVKWLYDRGIDWDPNCTRDITQEDMDTASKFSHRLWSAMVEAARNGHLEVVQFLYGTKPKVRSGSPLNEAVENGHLEMVQWIFNSTDLGHDFLRSAMEKAAANGHLNMLKWLHEKGKLDESLNWPVECGQLEVVKWFHANGIRRRYLIDLQQVAKNGHVGMLQWLFENGYANVHKMTQCPIAAAGNGHFEMVQWLHEHSVFGFTGMTMDVAIGSGNLTLVRWLDENRRAGCTTLAASLAARNGHLDVLQWLHVHRSENFTTAVMDGAAERGHIKIVRWLHENRSEGCTENALYQATRGGHLDAVLYLLEHRTEGFPANLFTTPLDVEVLFDAASGTKPESSFPEMAFKQRPEFLLECLQYIANLVLHQDHTMQIVEWLSQFRLILHSTSPITSAISRCNTKLVLWFHRQGFDVCQPEMIELAIKHGNLPLVVWYHEQGCKLDAPTYIELAGNCRDKPLMRWMIENGLEFDAVTAMKLAAGVDRGYPEVVWWLSEGDRLVVVLEMLARLDSPSVNDPVVLQNLRRLLWWTMTNTQFEDDASRLAIRDAILNNDATGSWLARNIDGAEVCSWVFPTSEGDSAEQKTSDRDLSCV